MENPRRLGSIISGKSHKAFQQGTHQGVLPNISRRENVVTLGGGLVANEVAVGIEGGFGST